MELYSQNLKTGCWLVIALRYSPFMSFDDDYDYGNIGNDHNCDYTRVQTLQRRGHIETNTAFCSIG